MSVDFGDQIENSFLSRDEEYTVLLSEFTDYETDDK